MSDRAQATRVTPKLPTPFLKWVGGKRALLEAILPLVPDRIDGAYYEPFIGGGAVFFALAGAGRIRHAVLSDMNADLVQTYCAVRDDLAGLIDRLDALAAKHSGEQYYAVRAQTPTHGSDIAARFIYLNKTCYNGLWRVNARGQFNVPMGRYKDPGAAIRQPETLAACSAALQGVEILHRPFSGVHAKAGDFVYADPPYARVNTSSFTRYQAGDFTMADQTAVRDWAETLARHHALVMLSNADTDDIRNLYAGSPFYTRTVYAPRAVNANAGARGKVAEVLITTYDPQNIDSIAA